MRMIELARLTLNLGPSPTEGSGTPDRADARALPAEGADEKPDSPLPSSDQFLD